ncbi:hypothetical protein COHA_002282 [Chlorella ohadii]|uniref:ABC transporter domain-containing protein n=1 Tax=Chlorella ohadii TaxID=2649997 RepID=A0AAD5H8U3_9CHLO|nr:hypothetical protein COHA_002282 [Chlorella ohadii]
MGAHRAPLELLMELTPSQKRVVAALVLGSGAAVGKLLQKACRSARQEQKVICGGLEPKGGPAHVQHRKVAVDAVFARRLGAILKICVPGPLSAEAGLIYAQGALLVARTLLTDYVSWIEGRAGRWIIQQDFDRLMRVMAVFVGVSIPAAVVNSGLKYMQKRIKLAFMRRLTHHLHAAYTSHHAYYSASTLGGLTHADQRITEDVERFAHTVSELYSYTFKPLLDVVLFTRSLSRVMGYKRQFALYGYYMLCAQVLRATSPPLAAMTAQETALAGSFRAAHQRLVASAEEVAFNDPPAGVSEQMILNQHLFRLLRHSRLSAFQQFVQQSLDGFLVKYGATAIALLIYALPLYWRGRSALTQGSQGEITADYISSMRLLSNTSKGIGDLVLVYKRLLERIRGLSSADEEKTVRQLYMRNISSSGLLLPTSPDGGPLEPLPEPRRLEGEVVRFHRVYLSSPDGVMLVKEMSFDVQPGRSCLIMGPNGSGKSSLLRVAAGLWPLQAGEVTLPPKGELFYLSQRPYLVAGTLRDQLLYPEPPRAVWATASLATRARVEPWMKSLRMGEEELEERLSQCLECVELDYLLIRGRGWDQVQNWSETLSGGEKQRLAMARLLFHAPRYAILDECTSAVSADGEQKLYSECVKAGITMLSIGHRPALRQFHSTVVEFEGVDARYSLKELRPSDRQGLLDLEGQAP